MQDFDPKALDNLYKPLCSSHKGQNGKLLLIGGSHLFHSASLWALNVASRIVDMVFYSSVPENNKIVHEAKKEFRDGIVVPREDLESYINEADSILIGPGMVRTEVNLEDRRIDNLQEINNFQDEGVQTYLITKFLLTKYPKKRWIIDGGALQMMNPDWLMDMPGVILTPHHKEFTRLFDVEPTQGNIAEMAKRFNCIILCKGEVDIVADPTRTTQIKGGNSGMTKGGTGDVLAGLVAGLSCKNDMYLSACAGSYYNKKAGEELFKRVGFNFNSSDLVKELPLVMK